MKNEINRFDGVNNFLSNFYLYQFKYNRLPWESAEHAYQAMKAISPIDFNNIKNAFSPGQAKKLGKSIIRRPDWDSVKLKIMEEILYAKFSYPSLKQLLLDTGDAILIEGNNWGDTFWGVDIIKGGENNLGKLLMKIRNKIKEESHHA